MFWARSLVVGLIGGLIGCRGDLAADYQLTIVPELLPDQQADVLAESPDVKLLVRPPDGELSVWYLGQARSGTALSLQGRPPLSAGTSLGLIFEQQNAEPENWHRRATLAYGQASLDSDLAATGQQIELPILAPRVDAFSKFATLSGGDRRACGAVATLPDGRIFVFGGGDPDTKKSIPTSRGPVPVVSSDEILELDRTDDGWSDPTPAGTLPATDLTSTGDDPIHSGARACSAAYPVETGDGWRIFVFGGRYTYDYSSYNSNAWFEYDPDAQKITRQGEMTFPRSDLLVLPLGDNKLLVYGGLVFDSIAANPSYEIFTVGTGKVAFAEHADALLGEYGGFGTALGSSAVVCTGAAVSTRYDTYGAYSHYDPVRQCVRIEAQDVVTPLEDLKNGVFAGSIAPLPDGGLLVTGGTSEPVDQGKPVPASSAAYRWDPKNDSWSGVGPLKHARGWHSSIATPDGRVLIVGGVSEIGGLYDATGPSVRCTEVFDPDTNAFSETTCNDASSGQEPFVAAADGQAVVLQGIEYNDYTTDGGGALGVVSLIPVLP